MTDPHNKKPERLSETDFADERSGRNSLQGNDQGNLQNERKAVPDAKLSTDSVTESFDKIDKDDRADEDLGKANRSREA